MSRRGCCCGDVGCTAQYRSGEEILDCQMPASDLAVSSPWGTTTLKRLPGGDWKGFLTITTTSAVVATGGFLPPHPTFGPCFARETTNQLLVEIRVSCSDLGMVAGRPSTLSVSVYALMIQSNSLLLNAVESGGELALAVTIPDVCTAARTLLGGLRFATFISCSPLHVTSAIAASGAYSGTLTITS